MARLRSPLVLGTIAVAAFGCAPGTDVAPPPALQDDHGVAPVALVAEPSACPRDYMEQVPQAGQNDNFYVAQQDRDFWLMLPEPLGEAPRPVLVALNGTGEDGRFFAERAKLEAFVDAGFIVVAPSSAGNGTVWPVWDALRRPDEESLPNADLALFDTLVPCLAAHLPVDAKRIYAGGHSAGGHMTNALLHRRSDVLAGGIVASGVFEMTAPDNADALDDTFALVTWGGEADRWSGQADGADLVVPAFNFVEQAALASAFYDAQPRVQHARCDDAVGHAWLDTLNPWMAQALLAHPKGGDDDVPLAAMPDDTTARCDRAVFEYDAGLSVTCVGDAEPACQTTCQMFGDCAVGNATVGPVLAEQLTALGFGGDDRTECTGCVQWCEARSEQPADRDALDCIEAAQASPRCGPGVEGAQPLIDAVNECCDGRADSRLCTDLCGIIATNDVAIGFFPTCEAFG